MNKNSQFYLAQSTDNTNVDTTIVDTSTTTPVQVDTISTPPITETIATTFANTAQEFRSLFPQSLESSGYIILASVALVFTFYFILQAMLFRKLLKAVKEGQQTLKEMSFSLYIQQQLTEYRLLLNDLSYSNTPLEKTNARTQLYNHLNTIAMEICETKDKELSKQLAHIFFSKLKSRYLKLVSIPDGLIHFKYVSQYLIEHSTVSIDESLLTLRKNLKNEIKLRQETEREVITEIEEKPKEKKTFFLFRFFKKNKNKK